MIAQDLIKTLISETEERIAYSKKNLLNLSTEALCYKEDENEWNALECLDHLHHYAAYYHPAIEKKLIRSSIKNDTMYTETWLGKQFMKMFDEKKAKKYKTMSHLKPRQNKLDSGYVQRFIDEQTSFLKLLENAKKHSLQKNKIPLEFFKLIPICLGDLFQFLNAHDKRHLKQAIAISKKYNQ